MSKQVFISYKAEEYEEASRVRAFLQEKGISCWMAPESIHGGASYASEIPAAIRGCRAFVLILSEKAQQSKWVPRELDQAINDNKMILPFMIENCPLQDEFRFYLTNVQRYPAYADRKAAMERMAADIMDLLGIKESPNPEPEQKKETGFVPAPSKPPVRKNADEVKKVEKMKPQTDKKKRRTSLVILGIMILVSIVGALALRSGTTVKIADERYSKSENALYFYRTELTKEDMTSISKMKQLERLHLEDCVIPVSDLGPIMKNTLTTLVLNGSNLSKEQVESIDFSALSLDRLEIAGSPGFTTLEVLESSAATLTTLNIDNTSVSDIDFLKNCPQLTSLSADGNGITDISALAACGKLYSLSLNGNQISNLSALDLCTGLQNLELNENELEDLSGLEHCLKLEKIQAAGNKLTSIAGLSNAVLLSKVNLTDNRLEDVSVLGKSAVSLKELYLSNNQISDLSFLENSTELRYVALDHNRITSLKPLANAQKLESITAADNEIGTTEGIEGKEELLYVNLAGNDLKHVGAEQPLRLAETYGAVLDLSGNRLETLNVSYTNQYRLLAVNDCGMEVPAILTESKGFYVVFDYNEKLDWENIAATESTEYVVVGCPLDQQVNVEKVLGTYSTEFVDSAEAYYQIEDYLPDYVTGEYKTEAGD